MTSVQGRGCLHRERPSVAPFVAPSITLFDSSPPLESVDKLSNQPVGPTGIKPLANFPLAAIGVPKYSEDDLQRIFKAVLDAQAPIPIPAPAPAPILASIVSKVPWKKLKACSPDVYRGKFHMDCYNFCQQCEDYFANAKATRLTQIPFAACFLWNRISFCWQ